MLRHGVCGVRCVFTVQDTEGGYMQIYDNDLRYQQIQNKMMSMPQWEKAEHMEMSVPENELWRYCGDAACPSQNSENTISTQTKKLTHWVGMLRTKMERKKGLLCHLLLIFLVGCFVGWIYEEIFYWITEGMLRNRGILYGPWLPIYGAGTLIIYTLKPLKKHPVALYPLCALVSGVVEYIIGYINVRFLNLRLWDYRGLFLNLDGIVCFRSVMSFAVMGVAFLYLLEPLTGRVVRRIGSKHTRILCLVLLAVFVVDCVVSTLFRTPITY